MYKKFCNILILTIVTLGLTACGNSNSSSNSSSIANSSSSPSSSSSSSPSNDDANYYKGKRIASMTQEEKKKALIEIVNEAHPGIWDENGKPIKQNVTMNSSTEVDITKEKALDMVVKYAGTKWDNNWDINEFTADANTIIDGNASVTGHVCYFFIPHGGRIVPFFVDKTTGKLYEETERLSGQQRVYKLVPQN